MRVDDLCSCVGLWAYFPKKQYISFFLFLFPPTKSKSLLNPCHLKLKKKNALRRNHDVSRRTRAECRRTQGALKYQQEL